MSSRTLSENGRLPSDWFRNVTSDEIDVALPGIYEWYLEGIGLYIGKSKRLARRLREYPNNLRKMIADEPYRKGKDKAFRSVHLELRAAFDCGAEITVAVLENCAVEALSQRERWWIVRRRQELEGSSLRVLNVG